MCGGAWILRDSQDRVILHSQRVLTDLDKRLEARRKVLSWAIQSVAEHHWDNVIFASEDADLLGAILIPRAWPSFILEVVEVWQVLGGITHWRLEVEETISNKGAHLLAHSSIWDDRRHSYVATGSPVWLSKFLEKKVSSF